MKKHPDCEDRCQLLEHKGYHDCIHSGTCTMLGTAPAAGAAGWQLVPVEPTREMLDAWRDATRGVGQHHPSTQWPKLHYSDIEALHVKAYKAMLAASPAALSREQGAEGG